jgi:hypothetical protein
MPKATKTWSWASSCITIKQCCINAPYVSKHSMHMFHVLHSKVSYVAFNQVFHMLHMSYFICYVYKLHTNVSTRHCPCCLCGVSYKVLLCFKVMFHRLFMMSFIWYVSLVIKTKLWSSKLILCTSVKGGHC